jgi:Predicted acetyltransferase
MDISIQPMLIEQKSLLIQLMELYMYDFSLYSNDNVNEYGYFGYSHIDDYWNEDGRFPYLIRVDRKISGFVLVRSCCEYNEMMLNPHNIAEFFVMQKYRRLGVGKFVAMRVFDMHRGAWEVTQWSNNIPAQNFWKAVISEYTNGNYKTFGSLEEDHIGFTFYN